MTIAVDIAGGNRHRARTGQCQRWPEAPSVLHRYEESLPRLGSKQVRYPIQVDDLDQRRSVPNVLLVLVLRFTLRRWQRDRRAAIRIEALRTAPEDGEHTVLAADHQVGVPVAVQVTCRELISLDWQINVPLWLEAQLALVEEPREALGTVPLVLTEKGQVGRPVAVEVAGGRGEAERRGDDLLATLAPALRRAVVDEGIEVLASAVQRHAQHEVVVAVAIEVGDGP